VYREFWIKTPEKGDLGILGAKQENNFELYWQDEKDWLCIVELVPTDNPEARLFAADIIGAPGRLCEAHEHTHAGTPRRS
jgi:hypothetical protein